MMEVGRKKAAAGETSISSVIAAGSVWESRMKMDEVKGGIKVFNATTSTNSISKKSPVNGKRKPWNSDSSDGSKSPIQVRKMRSEGNEENSAGKIERSPIQMRKSKSELGKEIPIQLRKVKSDSFRTSNDNAKAIVAFAGTGENSEKLKNPELESKEDVKEVEKGIDESVKEIEKPHVEICSNGSESDETCKEFGVCHISKENEDEEEEKVETDDEEEEEEVVIEIEKKSFDIKEISLPEPKKVVNEVKKFHQIYEKPVTIVKQSTTNQNLPRPTPTSDEYHTFQEKNTKLQSFVDLIMWKDVPRSAFVFGIGSFFIISSSYAKDINISFISVMSYLGLFYLAATFLYRSIICRGVIEMDNMRHVVGEEEAIWVLKFILPYLNEFLLKLRALFCGDPVTTMKLAVLLFALARCGSSITIWKVAKWGFFGVFTVPKVCSSYSSQFAAYGKFWVRRFRDAWESCSHKKGVALAIFVLVWNLSSVVARIWAAFMLFVAFRYYQQSLLRDEWEEELEEDVKQDGDTCRSTIGTGKCRRGPLFVDITHGNTNNTKQKKKY